MPYRFCPVCRSEGRWLEGPSIDAYVTYYRCDNCNAVWVYDPKNVHEPIKLVSERQPPKS